MDLIISYLEKCCTPEQQSLLVDCFNTLMNFGLVEIDFQLDELMHLIENMDTFTILQVCYQYVRQYQTLAFNALGLEIDVEDIAASNNLLNFINVIEESTQHRTICEVIDSAETAEDAFIGLLTEVCLTELTQIEPIIGNIPTEFIERVYKLHHSSIREDEIEEEVESIDSRKIKLLNSLWNVRNINHLRDWVKDSELNLPIQLKTLLEKFRPLYLEYQAGYTKENVASKILELVLLTDTPYKDIKPKMKEVAKMLYSNNLLYLTELSYQIDNLCMERNLNGSF